MGARLRLWWQQIKKHWIAILVVVIILVVAIALIIIGYRFDWTGFKAYDVTVNTNATRTTQPTNITVTLPSKTLYDWLQLLIIPAVLAVAGYVINLTISRGEQAATEQRAKSEQEAADKRAETERQIAKERYEQDQQIALDKQHEDLLQVYLDRMSELLLEKNLRSSAVDTEVRNVAQVRTITILHQLDARRIGYIFAFLREAGLMSNEPGSRSIVSLSDADLREIKWSQADLSEADLRRARLERADLRGANLLVASLSDASLSEANLSEANLSHADLSRAHLSLANLLGANLSGAHLSLANLLGANLSRADLSEADLLGASLSRADLSEADLSGTAVTEEQLKEAKSLKGATMPDGSKHP